MRLINLTLVASSFCMLPSVANAAVIGSPADEALEGANFIVTAVPEPGTWAMMLMSFGMVAGASRYRRRSTNTVYA